MRTRAVVFDMDGVIVDSERYWEAEVEVILDAAVGTDEVSYEDVVGINVYDQYDALAERYPMRVDRDGYFDLYDERAEAIYAERASLLEGFGDLLDALDARGVPVGLCSSSFPHWIRAVLERFDLAGRFEAVVSAADLDVPGKPEPAIYEAVARRLGVAPAECVVVEDSESGIEAADRAGAYVVAYAHDAGTERDYGRADEVATDPADLRERLLRAVDEGTG